MCSSRRIPYNPQLAEAKINLKNYEELSPEILRLSNKFNPQYAEAEGRSLSALYAGTIPAYENIIAPGIARAEAGAQRIQRAGDLQDFQDFGQQYVDAQLNADPRTRALYEQLNTQASTELGYGRELSPEQQRLMQQYSRAAYGARGLSGTNSALADETFRQLDMGEQLLRQRQGFAGQVLGYNKAIVGDPYEAITGRASQTIGAANSLFNQGTAQLEQSGANDFNPLPDAYTTAYRNQDIKLAQNAQKSSNIFNGIKAGGSIIGSALGGI